ncbi:MAG: DNA repair protein RecO C-terminal domain-containing protein [Planctomycetota bacterium]|jgi:DNA repair protein RecO (recombination protein O)|nr:DNA repair protein RecO C-terminal domain-containing protein [Planctomycetota bacterium]
MRYLNTRALVLRRSLYSESSVTLALFSREHGRTDALAKGARRDKSPLFGHLGLYHLEDVTLLERPSSGMDILTEAAFVDEHVGLCFFPPALAAAGTLAELALLGCMPRDPHPEIFHILVEGVGLLSRLGEPSARAGLADAALRRDDRTVLVHRALRVAMTGVLRWLGFGLELSRCIRCGKFIDASRPGKIRISFRGGVVCEACRARGLAGSGRAGLSGGAFAALKAASGDGEFDEMSLSPGERRELLRFLVDYSQYVLEKTLGGAKVLFQLLR